MTDDEIAAAAKERSNEYKDGSLRGDYYSSVAFCNFRAGAKTVRDFYEAKIKAMNAGSEIIYKEEG
jgi:hypothetical protein